ncbi:MAG: aldehyde dehydrogenase [Sphingobacteriales bacterium]|nr:aldehyde dehydrogenase [Sphingobacteriales bacterium]
MAHILENPVASASFIPKESTVSNQIADVIAQQNRFFASGVTKDANFRVQQLRRLRQAIQQYEPKLFDALHADLHKSNFESFGTEIGVTLSEIDGFISHVPRWAKPHSVGTSLFHFPASSRIYYEPFGKTLIIAPWNYPFLLSISPLAGALAAGNTAVIKPSELTVHTSAVMQEMLEAYFPAEQVAVFQGDAAVAQQLLAQPFEFVFFTGSTRVGKIVYEAAAKNLTPAVLELGGKSPCVVDKDIHLTHTARRIVWGKFLNAGQTCIAPDYVLVHRSVKDALIAQMKKETEQFFGSNPQQSSDYVRIINHAHFDRLLRLIDASKVVHGGTHDRNDRYIAPTILDGVQLKDAVMQEEIFGPILPVLTYENTEEALAIIRQRPKPLSLYVFSKDKKWCENIIERTSSGGGCINDTIVHISNKNLGFGGVGNSGLGKYHGKNSFEAFSNRRGILDKKLWLDVPLRYAPYNKLSLDMVRKIYRWFF